LYYQRTNPAMGKRTMSFRLGLVTPVFNDWESLSILLRRISELYRREDIAFSVVAIDDGSTARSVELDIAQPDLSCIGQFGIPTVRGERCVGESKMNLVALVIHGLSAISVYVDVIFVRLLLGSAALIGAAILATLCFVCYKLFTDLATPGWTTTVASTFTIIIIQAGIFVVGTTLMLLGGRSNYTIVPALDERYVETPVARIAEQCAVAPAASENRAAE
jgi:hypothetical protein